MAKHKLHFARNCIALFLILVGIAVISTLYYVQFELPDTAALKNVQLQVPLQIYTNEGKLLATFGEKRRIPIPYAQIPKPLIEAVLATEDQRYFQHPGVDFPGLIRAAIQLVITGRKEQGGSTITMQVARSFYLTRHKTFGRKLREILLALKIENTLPKEKILELYLNKIFFGNRAYGVGAAAEVYYGKPLDQLSIDQYAMIAGIPKAPSVLNPLANQEAAIKRRNHVLTRLFELNHIDEKTYRTAMSAPLGATYHDLQAQIRAPYVAELAREQAEKMYGDDIYTDGYKIYTTVDGRLQAAANRALYLGLTEYDQRHGYRGPEQNVGIPNIKRLDKLEEQLRETPVSNGLEPAIVMDISDQSLAVLRANGTLVTVPWEGLSWARKAASQLQDDSATDDNSDEANNEDTEDASSDSDKEELGPRPHHASDIAHVGDVIRLMPTDAGGFRLAQIPKAEASLIALNPPTGAILAMVGGFDYTRSKFNRIISAERQPGSSFKPFIYSAALDHGYTLASVINDAPLVLENPQDGSLWRPQNSTHRFYGPTRLRTAIIHSRNLVSIRLLEQIGISYAMKYAQRFGFSKEQMPHGLSLALGTAAVTPLQMASAYSVFANGGYHTVPYIINRILNSQGQTLYMAKPLSACVNNCAETEVTPAETNESKVDLKVDVNGKGETVVSTESKGEEAPPAEPKPEEAKYAPRVIPIQNAYLITSVLHDVIQRGTAISARHLNRSDLSGKTGTTNNQYDAWFAGYNKELVAVAWMGYDQPQSLYEYGNQAALPLWMHFMQEALKNHPEHAMEQPEGIVSVRIDPANGKRASASSSNAIFEYFMKPYLPDEYSPSAQASDEAGNESNDLY